MTASEAAYQAEFQSAERRLTAAIQKFAGDPRFREAVTWQNPKLVKLCLDKVVAGEPRTARGRIHEQAVANYVQRYSTKNDTIGFVGPVGWGRWTDSGAALTQQLGERLLARRTVYFECWAVDAVARTLSADPELRPWLVPRLLSAHVLAGGTLRRPNQDPLSLTGWERELLCRVDGVRSVRELAAAMAGSAFPEFADQRNLLPALDELVSRDLLQLDLVGGIEAFPERTLLARLERIGDPAVRERATGRLAGLLAARDRVGAAAGDDVALEAALAELGDCFSALDRAGRRTPARRDLRRPDRRVRGHRPGLPDQHRAGGARAVRAAALPAAGQHPVAGRRTRRGVRPVPARPVPATGRRRPATRPSRWRRSWDWPPRSCSTTRAAWPRWPAGRSPSSSADGPRSCRYRRTCSRCSWPRRTWPNGAPRPSRCGRCRGPPRSSTHRT